MKIYLLLAGAAIGLALAASYEDHTHGAGPHGGTVSDWDVQRVAHQLEIEQPFAQSCIRQLAGVIPQIEGSARSRRLCRACYELESSAEGRG